MRRAVSGRALRRVVLHVDMDAFYAAVEVREDPALSGKPVIVGHPGRRGVVSTCSYEARRFGVHSAMPSVTAMRLCPDAVWVRGRMELYARESRKIRAILADISPLVQPLSIDEAFVDLTGLAADLDAGVEMAREIKQRIRDELRLTASVGVAPNKFLAKVASDLDKPDGLVLLRVEEVVERLWPMPIERLWGVGPKTAKRLRASGFRAIGDIVRHAASGLDAVVGPAMGEHLRCLARGEDDRPVEPHQEARSISEERTYGADLVDPERIDRALLARAEGVARRLRQSGLRARTVQLKVRAGDFTTWTRARTLPEATDLAEPIVRAARELFAGRIELDGRGVRLLGVGVSGIERAGAGQAGLFVDPDEARARRVALATDAVRARLGESAVTRARLLERPSAGAADDGRGDDGEASSLPAVD